MKIESKSIHQTLEDSDDPSIEDRSGTGIKSTLKTVTISKQIYWLLGKTIYPS